MPAFWDATVSQFLLTEPQTIVGALALAQQRHYRTGEAAQLQAWEMTIAVLRPALSGLPEAASWQLLLEYPLLRLGRRADAILLTDRAVLVIEIKAGLSAGFGRAGLEQVDDYALDLQDFHAGSRGWPIVPILVATDGRLPPSSGVLALSGTVLPVQRANAASLPALLAELAAMFSAPTRPLTAAAWMAAPYRPLPTLIEAARMLYSHHGVTEIAEARADADSIGRTSRAVAEVIERAQRDGKRHIVFITGIPGAGKTLCGLNAAFAGEATFLTGNPTLVHVLREALARDAIQRGVPARVARQRMEGLIQALPRFRDHYVLHNHVPAERVVVVDEAQRSWSVEHAIRKSRDRVPRLTDSEPGHLLRCAGAARSHTAALVRHGLPCRWRPGDPRRRRRPCGMGESAAAPAGLVGTCRAGRLGAAGCSSALGRRARAHGVSGTSSRGADAGDPQRGGAELGGCRAAGR